MKRILTIVAKAISIVLYPLFIPTYGMALFCWAYNSQIQPLSWVWMVVAIFGTLALTCVIPLTAILLMIRRGDIKDIYIDEARERAVPYLYTTFSFGFWSYLMIGVLHAPRYIGLVTIGATVAIALVAIINHWWKISAHLTGIGGLFGGLLSYCLGIGAIPTWSTFSLWLIGSLVVMFARLRLNAHTGGQVAAGWLLGLLCTFLPFWIALYVA